MLSPYVLMSRPQSHRPYGEPLRAPQAPDLPSGPAPGMGPLGESGSGGSPPVRDHQAPVARFSSSPNVDVCHTTSAPPSQLSATPDGSPWVPMAPSRRCSPMSRVTRAAERPVAGTTVLSTVLSPVRTP